jgi:menaquinone-9 beta-reductase
LKKVVIIGGGISGLVTSVLLVKAGIECTVIERKNYPLHRVCGEYISNEAVPFLKLHGLYPGEFNPSQLSRFQLSSISGRNEILPLEMGGFGISRFSFDNFLFTKASQSGVKFILDTSVENVEFLGQSFRVQTGRSGHFSGDVVLGAFGKRSNIDSRFHRAFMKKRSPYVGVKYHVKFDMPGDLICLHNFPGGYCGVSKVENDIVNVCYLVHREKIKAFGSIAKMEQHVLCANPLLKQIFKEAEFVFDKPEVINEISFEKKSLVENGVLMIGDAAGMITPLCGNGMAMAIHSAKIASEHVLNYLQEKCTREEMEKGYVREWSAEFSRRLFSGRLVQRLFGSETGSKIAINLALYFKPLAREIIRNTHGQTF